MFQLRRVALTVRWPFTAPATAAAAAVASVASVGEFATYECAKLRNCVCGPLTRRVNVATGNVNRSTNTRSNNGAHIKFFFARKKSKKSQMAENGRGGGAGARKKRANRLAGWSATDCRHGTGLSNKTVAFCPSGPCKNPPRKAKRRARRPRRRRSRRKRSWRRRWRRRWRAQKGGAGRRCGRAPGVVTGFRGRST